MKMKKTVVLTVTAFLLSAQVIASDNLEKTAIPFESITGNNQNQLVFQKWIRKNHLLGKKWSEIKSSHAITTEELVASLPPELKHYSLRIIKPNEVVTMEYTASRINIGIDEYNIIRKIYLG